MHHDPARRNLQAWLQGQNHSGDQHCSILRRQRRPFGQTHSEAVAETPGIGVRLNVVERLDNGRRVDEFQSLSAGANPLGILERHTKRRLRAIDIPIRPMRPAVSVKVAASSETPSSSGLGAPEVPFEVSEKIIARLTIDMPVMMRTVFEDGCTCKVQLMEIFNVAGTANVFLVKTSVLDATENIRSAWPRFFLALASLDPDPHVAFMLVNLRTDKEVPGLVRRVRAKLAAEFSGLRSRVKRMWLGSTENRSSRTPAERPRCPGA